MVRNFTPTALLQKTGLSQGSVTICSCRALLTDNNGIGTGLGNLLVLDIDALHQLSYRLLPHKNYLAQAHGRGVLEHEGRYYWYGEDKNGETFKPFRVL